MRRISAALFILSALLAFAGPIGCSRHNSVGNTTVPKSPMNLIGQPISASAVRLSWADDSDNETEFVIYRNENGVYRETDRVPADIYVYSDIGLRDSTTYYYYVVAANEMGSSRSSNIIAVTTPHSTSAPYAPSDPSPGDLQMVRNRNITLTWKCDDPNNDPITYNVHFGTDPNPPSMWTGVGDKTIGVTDLQNNTLYYWRVIALDQRQETAGPTWQFLTDSFMNQPPDMPSVPYPEDGSAQIPTNASLTWSGGDADGDYLIYDIYFGATNPPPYLASQFTTTFVPPYELEPLTIYRWQVVVRDGQSETRGPVWKFSTGEGPVILGRLRTHDPVFDVWISSEYIYVAAFIEDRFVVSVTD